ncbi:MAG: hypothetical protein Greene041679_88, partial [Parcubacteria group bacterium Greene0416_79]
TPESMIEGAVKSAGAIVVTGYA